MYFALLISFAHPQLTLASYGPEDKFIVCLPRIPRMTEALILVESNAVQTMHYDTSRLIIIYSFNFL